MTQLDNRKEPSPVGGSEAQEREAFEAWARDCGCNLRRYPPNGDRYSSVDTAAGWHAWQAARATAAAPAAPSPVMPGYVMAPKGLTPRMMTAGFHGLGISGTECQARYAAILEAAPAAPVRVDADEDRRKVLQLLYEAHHREPCGPTLEAIGAAIQHLQAVDVADAAHPPAVVVGQALEALTDEQQSWLPFCRSLLVQAGEVPATATKEGN